jgi:hypothetical protein
MTENWKYALPLWEESDVGLLLDEATYTYAYKTREKIGDLLAEKGLGISPVVKPYFTGFDYLAAGLIDDGIAVVKKLLDEWKAAGFTKMVTLCGQSQYLFTVLLPWLGLETEMEFISILDLAESMDAENAYLYGGSYYTRYLRKDALLNKLLKNTKEAPILTCPEFLPEVDGDKRKNVVGIWTPPLCAEYHPIGMPEGLADKIYADSLALMKECHFKNLIVCDPYAYRKLLEKGYPKNNLIYFTEVLK